MALDDSRRRKFFRERNLLHHILNCSSFEAVCDSENDESKTETGSVATLTAATCNNKILTTAAAAAPLPVKAIINVLLED